MNGMIDAPAAPRRPVESRDPATGEVWRRFESADVTAVHAALAASRAAQRHWAGESVAHRARMVERFRRVLFARRHEVADVIRRENGKPEAEAMATEVMTTLDLARFFARHAPHVLADQHPIPGNIALFLRKRMTVRHEPHGVVAVISPWNYPFMLAAGLVLPALIAGNGVLFKPSEFSPSSGLLLTELLAEAGVPAGLLQLLPGDGLTGAAVVSSGVDKVFFIGSAATGKKIAVSCATRLVECVLELGGSDPAIVLADADLDTAASGIAWGRFSNAGQTCIAPKRVLVEDAVFDAFMVKLAARVHALRVGPGSSPTTDVGPVIGPGQKAVLRSQLDDAIARGAKVAAQGVLAGAEGDFFPPTLLVDVTADMKVMKEETFGPLLPILRVRDVEDAVRIANETGFGLSASIWTRDTKAAQRLAARIDSGTVVINDTSIAAGIAELSYGGVKESGFGHSHGTAGLLSCARTRAVISDRFAGIRQPWWFAYGPRHAADLDGYLNFWHGRALGARVVGAWRSMRLLFFPERPV
jgi:acyl-CoA reductase-like NAD-dependent aldehyde dehydrogenase